MKTLLFLVLLSLLCSCKHFRLPQSAMADYSDSISKHIDIMRDSVVKAIREKK